MTESEALEILDLSSTATKEEQQSAFYNLRAGLSEQTKIAPTPMLRERFTKRLSKVYEAQKVLGLKFSEEDPHGSDPLFGDTPERAVENNLPTTDDGKNNLPARENTPEKKELEREPEKKEPVEIHSTQDKTSELAITEKNEAKFREALKTAIKNGKGIITVTFEDILALKQIQLDIPEVRALEMRKEMIEEYGRASEPIILEKEVPKPEKKQEESTDPSTKSQRNINILLWFSRVLTMITFIIYWHDWRYFVSVDEKIFFGHSIFASTLLSLSIYLHIRKSEHPFRINIGYIIFLLLSSIVFGGLSEAMSYNDEFDYWIFLYYTTVNALSSLLIPYLLTSRRGFKSETKPGWEKRLKIFRWILIFLSFFFSILIFLIYKDILIPLMLLFIIVPTVLSLVAQRSFQMLMIYFGVSVSTFSILVVFGNKLIFGHYLFHILGIYFVTSIFILLYVLYLYIKKRKSESLPKEHNI